MRKLLASVVVAPLLLIGVLAPTAEAAAPVVRADQPRYCATLVGKASPGQESPVLAESCSSVSQAVAEAGLEAQRGPRTQTLAGYDGRLMIWWENANYSGYSNVIYGESGTCDRTGYRITPSSYWQNNLSSISRLQTCDRAVVRPKALNNADIYNLPAAQIRPFDNNVGSVQVYSSFG